MIYLYQFWSDDIIELIVEQINQYKVLKNGKSVNTNFAKMEQFLDVQMMMGIVQMSANTNYWAGETRVNMIPTQCPENGTRSYVTPSI